MKALNKRVFLIVLDSFGIGEAPDAEQFGDVGANTLGSIARDPAFRADNLRRLGLFNLEGVTCGPRDPAPIGSFARLQEASMGKDTTIGHWEIAGVESPEPLPTFPQGFPQELLQAFSQQVGRGVLCNKPYSGTQVIRDYGEQHLKTGDLIVYTSADSVFQVAANEALVPPQQLYRICEKARTLLQGPWGVGRVIARPFVGDCAENFTRTTNRRDFSLKPPRATMLDYLSGAGCKVVAVGKIGDIFAGQGITYTIRTHGNAEGMEATLGLLQEDFRGLAFVNLVDYDMLYGHRRDIAGYAAAVAAFDAWLPRFLQGMGPDDLLILTGDHGCDPGFTKTTDHTREYVPCLIYGQRVRPGVDLGTCRGFGAIANTICAYFGVRAQLNGEGLWSRVAAERPKHGAARTGGPNKER